MDYLYARVINVTENINLPKVVHAQTFRSYTSHVYNI